MEGPQHMVLLSPKEDFVQRTLAAIAGLLARLAYVANLREDRGYDHWGLERIYGDQAARMAIGEAHSDLWSQVLRTPLRRLAAEYESESQNQERKAEMTQAMEEWEKDPQRAIPADLRGGSVRHFNSIVSALSCLSHGRSVHGRSPFPHSHSRAGASQ